MGDTRHIGLGVQNDRDEEERRRKDEESRRENQVRLNKWAFRSGCLKRHHEYNEPDSSEVTPDGSEAIDGNRCPG